MQKIVETRSSLSNTIKYASTIMRNPSLHKLRQMGLRMIVLVYLIVLLRELCFHYFLHGASLHFTLVYKQVNEKNLSI